MIIDFDGKEFENFFIPDVHLCLEIDQLLLKIIDTAAYFIEDRFYERANIVWVWYIPKSRI